MQCEEVEENKKDTLAPLLLSVAAATFAKRLDDVSSSYMYRIVSVNVSLRAHCLLVNALHTYSAQCPATRLTLTLVRVMRRSNENDVGTIASLLPRLSRARHRSLFLV